MKKILLTVLCFGLFGGFVLAEGTEKTAEQQKQEKINKQIAADDAILATYCTDFQQIVEIKTVEVKKEEGQRDVEVTKLGLELQPYSSKTSKDPVIGYWLAAIDGEFSKEFEDLSKPLTEKTEKTYSKLYRDGGFSGLRHYVYKNSETAPPRVVLGGGLMDEGSLFCPDYGHLADAYVDSGAGEIPKRKCRERLNELLTRGCKQALNVIFGTASESDGIKKKNAADHKTKLETVLEKVKSEAVSALVAIDLSTKIKEESDGNKKKKLEALDVALKQFRESHNVYRKKLEDFQKLFVSEDWAEKEVAYEKELEEVSKNSEKVGGVVYVPFWDAKDSLEKFQNEMGDFEVATSNFSTKFNKEFAKVFTFEDAEWPKYVKEESPFSEANPLRAALNVYMTYYRSEAKALEEAEEKDEEISAVHFATKKYIQDRIKQIAFSSLSEGVSSFNVSQTLSTNPDSIEGELTLFNDEDGSTNFFDKIIKLVTGIVGTLGVIILIIAIVMLVTANGDDTQISKAKELILYTVVGLLVIFMSYMIIQFVIDLLVF